MLSANKSPVIEAIRSVISAMIEQNIAPYRLEYSTYWSIAKSAVISRYHLKSSKRRLILDNSYKICQMVILDENSDLDEYMPDLDENSPI